MPDAREDGGSAPADGGGAAAAWPPPPALAGGVALIAAVALLVALLAGGGQRLVPARVSGIPGSAQLRVVGERGELIVRGLTPAPPGEAYEVWLEPPHSPPLPTQLLFTIGPGGSADLRLPGTLRGISQVLVTPEPAGGSLAPTHAPVIVIRVP